MKFDGISLLAMIITRPMQTGVVSASFLKEIMVMVRIHLKRLSPRANKKLNPCKVGPLKLLKKLSSNPYTLKLPSDLGFSPTFNVGDLTLYRGHVNDEESKELTIFLPIAPPLAEKIIDVLDDQLIFTRQ